MRARRRTGNESSVHVQYHVSVWYQLSTCPQRGRKFEDVVESSSAKTTVGGVAKYAHVVKHRVCMCADVSIDQKTYNEMEYPFFTQL